jgi:predicted DNA-binding transcriptional regulator YafY
MTDGEKREFAIQRAIQFGHLLVLSYEKEDGESTRFVTPIEIKTSAEGKKYVSCKQHMPKSDFRSFHLEKITELYRVFPLADIV